MTTATTVTADPSRLRGSRLSLSRYTRYTCYTRYRLHGSRLSLYPLHPLQAAWLASLVALPSAESRTAFEQVPAFVVLDMCYWLKFAAQHRIDDLAVQPLHRTVRALAALLRAGSDALCGGKRLIRSPLVLSEVRL